LKKSGDVYFSNNVSKKLKRIIRSKREILIMYIGFPHNWRSRVDCERTTDYESPSGCLNLTLLVTLFVFLICRLTSDGFTIDSSTPTLWRNLNEHPIELCISNSSNNFYEFPFSQFGWYFGQLIHSFINSFPSDITFN
jgi:hypothetical protein